MTTDDRTIRLGNVLVPYKGAVVPLRFVAQHAPIEVFERVLQTWASKRNRMDILTMWKTTQEQAAVAHALQPYLSWIHAYFDSIDAFLFAWKHYPSAVQRSFPSSVLSQLEPIITRAVQTLPNEEHRALMLRFCETPLFPLQSATT